MGWSKKYQVLCVSRRFRLRFWAMAAHGFDLRTPLYGKLESYTKRIPMNDVTPATAHLFTLKPFTD
jgi:hypothetical protein